MYAFNGAVHRLVMYLPASGGRPYVEFALGNDSDQEHRVVLEGRMQLNVWR
jgi:hypothetical protein